MNDDDKKPGAGSSQDSFLSRWSRRKQQVREGRVDAVHDAAEASAREPAAPLADAPSEKAEVDLAKLTPIDELNADSDFTQFLQKGVPEELKRLALRRAWALDPAIRDFIEIAENQYDFNAPHTIPGFGDIAPGTSMETLLAQATGQQPAKPAPEVASDAAPGPEEAREVEVAGMSGDATAPDAPDQPASDAAPSETPVAANADLPPPAEQHAARSPANDATLRPVRRRHGGALPG